MCGVFTLQRHHVLFHSNNKGVGYILNSRTSKIPVLMCLLCHLTSAADSISPSPLNMSLGSIIALLTVSHFHWHEFQMLALEAQSSPVCSAGQIDWPSLEQQSQLFTDPSFGSLHVHMQILPPDGQAAPQQLSLPEQQMDIVPVCYLPS